MRVVINDIEYFIENADALILEVDFREAERYLYSIYDIARDYQLTIITVHDYFPRLLASFKPEKLYVFTPDRRPLFEVLTGKRALGLSPPRLTFAPFVFAASGCNKYNVQQNFFKNNEK